MSDLSKFSSDKPKSLSHGEEKESITDYEVLSSDGKMDLVKFMPLTGRMHQIRLHSLELGSPIVGDKKYGNIANTNLMLHAHKIKLDKSIFGEEIIITSNMPDYFSMFYPNISVQS
ncbi:MAG UNVERIFIED_CONTAM: RNA pseudouridine synthase [Rickettsiaceae bacterium]